MSIVALMSGGLDSSAMAIMCRENGLDVIPLFVDYGQRAAIKERESVTAFCQRHDFPTPIVFDIGHFGHIIHSGITNDALNIIDDAFLPGRNLLFLLCGASLAANRGYSTVAIGLISEETHLFPDQTRRFLDNCETTLSSSVGSNIEILSPLLQFSKKHVVDLGRKLKVGPFYSCHAGRAEPCGNCIACKEYEF